LIFGVGPVTAKKIVKRFGRETLNILATNPEKRSQIRGISPNKAKSIADGYKEIRAMQEVVMYFCKFDISLNMAIKIYKQYGETAVAVASRNPYSLIETIDGIGFLTADKMANKFALASPSFLGFDGLGEMGYTINMNDSIEFNEAAFKHGITRDNIRWAVTHPRYEGPLENAGNQYLLLGFDANGNLLEILYNRIDDETVNIFHAMRCRSIYFPLLED
jgi:hypothetical protein